MFLHTEDRVLETTPLKGAAIDPDAALDSLPPLMTEDLRQIEWRCGKTCQSMSEPTLHGWFENQAFRTPDAPAVHADGRSYTYRELSQRADQMALRLAAAGAACGTLVALCLERSFDMVAGLLAILKTGAAYLPLDPAFPAARLSLIVADAAPGILLTQQSLRTMLPETSARVLFCEDDDAEGDDDGDARRSRVSIDQDAASLAYVLYTSGSTGRPKGVEVPHRAIVNLLASMRNEPGFTADDALLAVTTIAFDIAMLELFLPLVSGGRVVLASRTEAADPRQLADLISRSRCTVMQATPATWRGLIAAGWKGDQSLRVLCGGEAMSRELADTLLPRCAAVWNMYGPTETTVWSTIHRVQPGGDGPVPIGRPIANTVVFIQDESGAPVLVGTSGELTIGGFGVANGYRGNPTLSDERFIASPFSPGERLYRTGDIARYRDDGAIEWLGRADSQVKIRGFRIEVQEIEAALERHPDIACAAVRTWPDTRGQPMLAAYLVMACEGAPESAALRAFLRRTLPDYMIPSRTLALAALPLTPNGKVDRNALPDPGPRAGYAEDDLPAGDRERKLVAIWQNLLDVRDIGPRSDFFELGGDSILAVSLLLSIEAEFGRRLTMAALFQAPTLASMAAVLGEAENQTRLPLAAEIQPKGTRPSLFWIDGGPMFLPLAGALGMDQPFLGVTLNPEELREVGFEPDLETIARHLLRTITTIQPSGPYALGGYCAGGVLAYEVASQLMAAGHAVGMLCIIDAQNPTHFKRVGNLAVEFAKLRHHVEGVWRAGGRRLDYVVAHGASAYRRLLSRSQWRPVMKSEPFTLGEIMQPAVAAYRPRRYAGPVALFQARRPKALDLRPGWAEVVTGELIAHEFQGAHRTMLEAPQVQELARLMNRCLARMKDAGDENAALAPV